MFQAELFAPRGQCPKFEVRWTERSDGCVIERSTAHASFVAAANAAKQLVAQGTKCVVRPYRDVMEDPDAQRRLDEMKYGHWDVSGTLALARR